MLCRSPSSHEARHRLTMLWCDGSAHTPAHFAAAKRDRRHGRLCIVTPAWGARLWFAPQRPPVGSVQQGWVACRELGQALARGTPTPPAWIARHGDQRVPLLLTVPCNDVPFRIPDAVLHALQADAALPGKWPQEGFDAEQTPRGEPAAAAAEAPPGGGSEAYSRHGSMVSSRSGIAGMGTLQQASFRSSRSVKSQDDVCVSPT